MGSREAGACGGAVAGTATPPPRGPGHHVVTVMALVRSSACDFAPGQRLAQLVRSREGVCRMFAEGLVVTV